jgi:hypothetical protein
MLNGLTQFMKTKRRMKRLSDADLMNLPKMENEHHLALTQVHRSLQLYAI